MRQLISGVSRMNYFVVTPDLSILKHNNSIGILRDIWFVSDEHHGNSMAAIREQKLSSKRLRFSRVWQTARPLVASMGALVVLLLALTFFNNSEPPTEPSNVASVNDSAPEWVIVDSDDAGDEMTYSQALTVLYDPTMEAGDADGK